MFERMKEIIAEQLSTEADGITLETSFKDDLGADSLDLFELVMALEEEYGEEIPNEETRQAMEAVERREGLFRAKDADDLFRQLGI